MNPNIKHRTAERLAKEHLRRNFQAYGVEVDKYTAFDGDYYDSGVARLGKNVLEYLCRYKDHRTGREYMNTNEIDFENLLK